MKKIRSFIKRIEAIAVAVAMTTTLFSGVSAYGAELVGMDDYALVQDYEEVNMLQSDSDVINADAIDEAVEPNDTEGEIDTTNDSIEDDGSSETIMDTDDGVPDGEDELDEIETDNESFDENDESLDETVSDDENDDIIDELLPENEEEESEDIVVIDGEVYELQMDSIDEAEYLIQAGGFAVCSEEALEASSGVYTAIYNGLKNKKSSIDISAYNISVASVGNIFFTVVNEHPELYYVATSISYSYYGSTVQTVTPTYLKGFDDAAFNNAVQNAMTVVKPEMTNIEKAIALHDYLVTNTGYAKVIKTPGPVYTAYGALVNQSAVCQGYALAYKLLLDKVGIKAGLITSKKLNHAWNYVELNGKIYNVDTTWDDPTADIFGRVAHGYMFLSDNAISAKRHEADDWVITYNGATSSTRRGSDSTYDLYYWNNINSAFVWEDAHTVYYIAGTSTLYKGDVLGTWKELITANLNGWNAYGLYAIRDRLYYTRFDGIYSIKKDGTDARKCFAPNEGQFYGSALSYSVKDGYNIIKFCTNTGEFGASLGNVTGINEYTVTFKAGEKVLATHLVLEHDAAVPPMLPQKKGYTVEWDSDYSDITQNCTVSARYITIQYNITYNLVKAGALNSDDNPSEYNIEQAITFKSPTYPGYKFAGWFTNSKYSSTSVLNSFKAGRTGDITLYAKWTPIKPVAPAIEVEGESLVLDNGSILVDKGTYIAISGEENAAVHYTVNGTKPTASSTEYKGHFIVNENTTVKAVDVREKLVSAISATKLEIAVNDLVIEQPGTIDERRTLQLTASTIPSTTGFEDISWSSANENVATVDENGVVSGVYEGKTTITAQTFDWRGRPVSTVVNVTIVPQTHTVTFTGLRGKVIATVDVLERRPAKAPTDIYFPEGYVFSKWDKLFNYITEDITVNALYKPQEYAVVFDSSKGATPDALTYNIESNELALPIIEDEENSRFAGWYDNEQFEGLPVTYIPSGSTGDIHLYAKWISSKTLWMKWDSLGVDETLSVPYTGKAQMPAFEVYYGDKKLDNKKDYTFVFKNQINACEDIDSIKAPIVIITGKGNYAGKVEQKFIISRKNINDADVDIIPVSLAYNGKVQKVAPVVTWNGKKLGNKDVAFAYDMSDAAYINPGTYTVKLTGQGNYCGDKDVAIVISNLKDEASGVKALMKQCKVTITPFEYDGNNIDFTKENCNSHIKVTYNKQPLDFVGDTDADGYDVQFISSYGANPTIKDVGAYTVKVIGKGKYQGEVRATLKINGTSITTAKIAAIDKEYYDGNPKKPVLSITDKSGNPLIEGTHFTVEYLNNTEVGTASVVIKGINSYCNSTKRSFKIAVKKITDWEDFDVSFTTGSDTYEYMKGGVVPKVNVKYNFLDANGIKQSRMLSSGKEYTVVAKNNNSAVITPGKEPYVVITFKKNFKGSMNKSFNIIPKDMSKLRIEVKDVQENPVAGKYMSTPSLFDINGKKLGKGDYITTYEYRDKDNNQLLDKKSRPLAGDTITVTVTGNKNYTGTITGIYRIYEKGKSISSASVKIKPESLWKLQYVGEPIMLSKDDIEVKVGKTVVLENKDYDIDEKSYINNNSKGTAKVTIIGKGDWAGAKTISFSIKAGILSWWNR